MKRHLILLYGQNRFQLVGSGYDRLRKKKVLTIHDERSNLRFEKDFKLFTGRIELTTTLKIEVVAKDVKSVRGTRKKLQKGGLFNDRRSGNK